MSKSYDFIDLINAIALGPKDIVQKIIHIVLDENLDILLMSDENNFDIFDHLSSRGDDHLTQLVIELLGNEITK